MNGAFFLRNRLRRLIVTGTTKLREIYESTARMHSMYHEAGS